jgi:hypothetical protein
LEGAGGEEGTYVNHVLALVLADGVRTCTLVVAADGHFVYVPCRASHFDFFIWFF